MARVSYRFSGYPFNDPVVAYRPVSGEIGLIAAHSNAKLVGRIATFKFPHGGLRQ